MSFAFVFTAWGGVFGSAFEVVETLRGGGLVVVVMGVAVVVFLRCCGCEFTLGVVLQLPDSQCSCRSGVVVPQRWHLGVGGGGGCGLLGQRRLNTWSANSSWDITWPQCMQGICGFSSMSRCGGRLDVAVWRFCGGLCSPGVEVVCLLSVLCDCERGVECFVFVVDLVTLGDAVDSGE